MHFHRIFDEDENFETVLGDPVQKLEGEGGGVLELGGVGELLEQVGVRPHHLCYFLGHCCEGLLVWGNMNQSFCCWLEQWKQLVVVRKLNVQLWVLQAEVNECYRSFSYQHVVMLMDHVQKSFSSRVQSTHMRKSLWELRIKMLNGSLG